ncbi:MAG: endopeptidase La [Campylobacterales bacterium]|nr:endopeptidase La [Campylobacterales bacterium]
MELSNYNEFPQNIPVITEPNMFLYPFMIAPLFLSDEKAIEAANFAIENNLPVMICATKTSSLENNDFDSFYHTGVIGTIMRKVILPNKKVKILFQGFTRGRIITPIENDLLLLAQVDLIKNKPFNEKEAMALLEDLKDRVKILASVSNYFPQDLLVSINESTEPDRVVDLIASTMRLKREQSFTLLDMEDVEQRLITLIGYVAESIESAKLQKEIKTKVHNKIDKTNRDYFLKEQMKQIRRELGEDNQRDEEIAEYLKKLDNNKKHMPEAGYKEVKKQIERLSRMHHESADANLLQTYVEWALELPFGKFSKAKLSVANVEKTLDTDHYSLKKPKERIVEFFAVKELLELRGIKDKNTKGTILCFVGPPGVGKTSLANSIASSLKRELVRIALGGLEDVNELRGHRRTYIGAMPGRLVQGIISGKQMDPVIVLDEIDKIGRSGRGDPTAALLEILDPEQNEKFRDYYLNFDIDLSKAIFVATANQLSTIPAPLRDRLEIIEVSSYTPQEKLEIAKRYLIPQELKKHGLKKMEVSIGVAGLRELIDRHTRESGVRTLRRKIATVMRKSAKKLLENPKITKISITPANLKEFLDKEVFEIDVAEKKDYVGVTNGLAWTSVGGDVLKVEAVKIKGKGVMAITGSLGDVMKESSKIAFSVVKTLFDSQKLKPKSIKDLKKDEELYNQFDLHIHVPEGATPKDGPSAGITIVTTIASILSDLKVRSNVAMTGELTLTGKVLPIGGLKEKLIAAHKAKMKTILIPKKNFERDLEDLPEEVKKDLEIKSMDTIEDVLKEALVNY